MKMFVTGDTHGEYGRIAEFEQLIANCDKDEEIIIAVMGDFGYVFYDNFMEIVKRRNLEQLKATFVVVPGNHENYDVIYEHKIVDFYGAKAHKVGENIYYIKRGEIFEIAGKSFFCMGGGYSVDRYMRRLGESYWKQEMPTDEEYKYATENITRHRQSGKKIDYIFSHTAPESGLVFLNKHHGREEQPLNNYLQYLVELLGDEYIMHYYGHLHLDRDIPVLRQRVLWFDYVEIDLTQ